MEAAAPVRRRRSLPRSTVDEVHQPRGPDSQYMLSGLVPWVVRGNPVRLGPPAAASIPLLLPLKRYPLRGRLSAVQPPIRRPRKAERLAPDARQAHGAFPPIYLSRRQKGRPRLKVNIAASGPALRASCCSLARLRCRRARSTPPVRDPSPSPPPFLAVGSASGGRTGCFAARPRRF